MYSNVSRDPHVFCSCSTSFYLNYLEFNEPNTDSGDIPRWNAECFKCQVRQVPASILRIDLFGPQLAVGDTRWYVPLTPIRSPSMPGVKLRISSGSGFWLYAITCPDGIPEQIRHLFIFIRGSIRTEAMRQTLEVQSRAMQHTIETQGRQVSRLARGAQLGIRFQSPGLFVTCSVTQEVGHSGT